MDILNAHEGLQQAMYAISNWESTWGMAFEPTKSQAFQIDHHRTPWGLPAIRFNGFDVPEADQIKLLGVVFDRQLRFIVHIHSTLLRTNSRLYPSESVPRYSSSLHGRTTGFCPPNIRVQPTGVDGCICNHSESAGHCAMPWNPYLWPPVLFVSLSHCRNVAVLSCFFKLLCLPVPSPPHSVLPALDTVSILDIPATHALTRHQQSRQY